MDELLELRMAGSADSSKKDSIASPAATTPAGGGEITQATSTVTRDDLTGDREHSKENDGSGGDGAREGQPMPDMSKNWFSAENTLRVYGEVTRERRFPGSGLVYRFVMSNPRMVY